MTRAKNKRRNAAFDLRSFAFGSATSRSGSAHSLHFRKGKAFGTYVDPDRVPVGKRPLQQLQGELVLDRSLDQSLQWSRPVGGVVPLLRQIGPGCIGQLEGDV